VIQDLKMGFKFSLNEIIVETAILELGNNSYLIFMIFPKFFYIKFVCRKNHFRVRNHSSKVY
jgi:hypothetical protein